MVGNLRAGGSGLYDAGNPLAPLDLGADSDADFRGACVLFGDLEYYCGGSRLFSTTIWRKKLVCAVFSLIASPVFVKALCNNNLDIW